MQIVHAREKIRELSIKLSLPTWWTESVLVEYFDVRRYAEDSELWTFDFSLISDENLEDIPKCKVVIPQYHLLQNVRPEDIARRMSLRMVGAPVTPLDEADLIPEGLVNNTAFPSPMHNDISVWDPKLDFHQTAIIYDGGIFYQWKVAELYKIPGSNSGWFKSDLFELKDLHSIYRKLQTYRNSGELKKPNSKLRESIANDYQQLELVRQPLRKKILEYHSEHKENYDIELAKVPDPPRLSLFEGVKLTKEGYYVKTHMEPLFLRSAIRNLRRATAARKKTVQTPDDEEALIDEIEYSAMCIISATNCLESYINYIIAKYLENESKVFDDTSSHRQKWLWVPLALNIPFKFKVDEPPFSDFSNLVKWRNNVIHHIAAYNHARGPRSHTANQFNLENAELSLKVVTAMISKLSENSVIPLPQWLREDTGSVGYWNEVSSFITRKELKQNAHSKWRMFSATLTSSMNVPAAGSESQGIAMFGAIDDTLHFRIEAKNIHEDTGAQLRLRKQGKEGNIIADLVEPGNHANTKQGIIIKGSITDSSLMGPLEGQPISELIKLIEEEKVSVNLYLSSSKRRQIRGILHRSGRAPLITHQLKCNARPEL